MPSKFYPLQLDPEKQIVPNVESGSYQSSADIVITDATTSRTLSAEDNGKVLYFTSGSAITLNTASGLGKAFSVTVIQGGAGQITVVAGSGTTLQSYLSQVKTAGANAMISLFAPVADTFYIGGNLG